MTMKITLVKSLIGRHPDHVKTAKSLNLKKIGDVTEQPDNAATKGKIAQISYMIKVED
jgi:large subunit ribosomal protein L30